MLWKTEGTAIREVIKKPLSEQNIDEKQVEMWIKRNPAFLHENMVIIAQQHEFPSGEKADLIGVDEKGSIVIVEIKRGGTGSKVDVQSLKYASYVSSWTYDEIEQIAKGFFGNNPSLLEEEFHSLTTLLQDAFEEDFSVESLNRKQRIIIVGQKIDDRIGSVLVWLYEQNVDIKAVEFEPYEIDGSPYLYSRVVIPIKPYEEYVDVRRHSESMKPWVRDGEKWHRNERMSQDTFKLFNRLDQRIQSLFPGIDGPNWSQEFYITYRVAGHNWLVIKTLKTLLHWDFFFKPGDFTRENFAEGLSIDLEEVTFGEPGRRQKAKARITPEYDLGGPELENFLKACRRSFESLHS